METAFDETMSIDVIMRTWPETIRVILRHHMLCVGCPIAPFHTVLDSCREHGVDKDLFIRDLMKAIGSTTSST